MTVSSALKKWLKIYLLFESYPQKVKGLIGFQANDAQYIIMA